MTRFTVTPISLDAQHRYAARARAMRAEALAESLAALATLVRGWVARLAARRARAVRT